jgi:hypothetical protein
VKNNALYISIYIYIYVYNNNNNNNNNNNTINRVFVSDRLGIFEEELEDAGYDDK